jgi:rod shape determining protein RodA
MLKARFWRNFDWWLFGVTALLVLIGLLILYSITFKTSGASSPADVRNQVIYVLIGLAVMLGVAVVDYRVWSKLANWLYPLSLGLLVVVALVGHSALGATRWINFGIFQFQPSELSKLILIVALAKFFADRYDEMSQPQNLAISLLYLILPLGLVLAQPDLGTGLVLMVIWLVMALVARTRKVHILALLGAGLIALPAIVQRLKPYQRARLATFLNPTADPLRGGYNVVQATIAVGSGQLKGRGLAAGSQSQLNFLPSQHTDFIFAVLAEKLGFIGSLLLLALFTVLLLRALLVAYRARDRFGMFLGVGIATMFLFHVFINVGMNLGILPVTGIPLPFVSYGGTSLLVGMMAIGLLESIAIRHQKIQFGT